MRSPGLDAIGFVGLAGGGKESEAVSTHPVWCVGKSGLMPPECFCKCKVRIR